MKEKETKNAVVAFVQSSEVDESVNTGCEEGQPRRRQLLRLDHEDEGVLPHQRRIR